jgi:hypothetical protein
LLRVVFRYGFVDLALRFPVVVNDLRWIPHRELDAYTDHIALPAKTWEQVKDSVKVGLLHFELQIKADRRHCWRFTRLGLRCVDLVERFPAARTRVMDREWLVIQEVFKTWVADVLPLLFAPTKIDVGESSSTCTSLSRRNSECEMLLDS